MFITIRNQILMEGIEKEEYNIVILHQLKQQFILHFKTS